MQALPPRFKNVPYFYRILFKLNLYIFTIDFIFIRLGVHHEKYILEIHFYTSAIFLHDRMFLKAGPSCSFHFQLRTFMRLSAQEATQ